MNSFRYIILTILFFGGFVACSQNTTIDRQNSTNNTKMDQSKLEVATLGSGCFWCTEAVFQQLEGVISVKPGYSGGKRPNPTYEQVSSGASGHAEVTQITFNPEVITFADLLEVFWKSHDPTSLNRQGADVGTQYRSVIFYHDEKQKEIAEQYKQKLNEAEAFGKPVVTEITALDKFYPAEDYHVNYYNNNKNAPYCTFVIKPKVDKVRQVFGDKLKK